jgi:hypothetical protein
MLTEGCEHRNSASSSKNMSSTKSPCWSRPRRKNQRFWSRAQTP